MIERPDARQNDNLDQPTSAAYVTFSTTPDGPSVTMSVPSGQSHLMLATVPTVTGVLGSALGPYLMARALDVVGTGTPWQLQSGLLTLAALLPMAYIVISRRTN
ncbi:hypothetical protein [Streptomyces sp. Tu6071]|uniref:hypothetical protein n=1 Tax=Streptomyces sp. Tu6071 TaxID=355249 RepID=UPI0005BD1D41|nr:hypothetical protein [Streptomyces sp. Tu6071]